MTTFDMSCKPRHSHDITFQSMPPDTVLLNLASGYYFSTNRLGTAVWQRCDGETTVDDLIRDLQPQYAVSTEQLRNDVVEFVEQLLAEGLLLVDSHA